MGDGVWRHEESGLELFVREATDEAERSLELRLGGEPRATLALDEVTDLAAILRAWARANAPVPEVREAPEGAYFQVYFRNELLDAEGEPVTLDDLGSSDDDGAYTWDEESMAAMPERVQQIGRAVASAYEAMTGESWHPEADESARAWISVFQMPEDARLWKGFWDDFDEVDDAELLG